MKKGQYVRCPIVVEEGDNIYPRSFVLGKIVSINDLSEEVTIKLYDKRDSGQYYAHAFDNTVFPRHKVCHCAAAKNAPVSCKKGNGRILSRRIDKDVDASYEYFVMLENGNIEKFREEDLEIEYSSADYSPLKQMMEYEFQNPTWYANRLQVSDNLHRVNNTVYGFNVLAGCRTFLMAHQISTIVRAFESKPIRYMLADEVGLGKTIEACSIIKILSSENKNLKVLYLVPGALAAQWQNELYYKFNICAEQREAMIEYSNHFILPLESLDEYSSALAVKWDLLLVDETHRLLTQKDKFDLVLQISKYTENVLLLSATPIQDRKDEYLRLLSILQPEQYCKMSLSDFGRILNKQKKIQKRVNSLLRHLDRYDDYKEEILEKLTDLSEELDDSHLAKITAGMDFEANDLGKSVAEQALSYVTENYRIERKVIRNRRDFVNEKLASRVLIECGYEMQSEEVGYSERNTYYAVLQYISMLLENGDAELGIVKQLLQAMFSSPWALMDVISKNEVDDTGLISSLNLWLSQSEDEIKSADYYLDENPDEIKGRLLKAVDFIEQEIGVNDYSEGKIVVFSEFEETLSKLESILRGRSIRCVRFVSSMSKDELEESVYLFQNEQDCRIILCDATGGEGRNFQNADWLIHIDLPWTANSIEQRIGRLDRLGRETGHMEVKSVVFYALDSIEAQLFEIWNSGLSLFEKSLSGLEIITGELNERIDNAICSDVYNGLQNALEDIINMTEEASEAVEEEQLYDSGNIIYRPLSKAVGNMLKTYQCGETNLFQSAMLGWSTQAGLKSSKTKHEGVIQFGQENFSPMAAIQSLLIPPNWKKYEDTPIMRREGRILGTFDRGIAIKREDVLFFAPGDPVFESIIGNAVDSGRGRCSAFEIENAPFKCRGFVCIYNVEPDVNYLYEHGISTQLLSQFRMYLPMEQIFSFVATNEESKAVPEEDIISILKEKSIVLNANHLGSRKVKKDGYSPVEKFMLANPEEKWREYVKKVGKVARRKATEKALAQSDFEAARREITRIVNGYESECLYLDKDMSQVEVIRDKYEKVYHALSNPVLTLDSIAYIRIG